jgi:hypothetical protein
MNGGVFGVLYAHCCRLGFSWSIDLNLHTSMNRDELVQIIYVERIEERQRDLCRGLLPVLLRHRGVHGRSREGRRCENGRSFKGGSQNDF